MAKFALISFTIVLLGLVFVMISEAIATEKIELDSKSTADRIAEHGYPVETHNVYTEDGYILTVFRIPYSHKLQNQHKHRPIVLLQHGIFSSSDSWILLGPNDSLAYILSDAGFDVWLGNSRGNNYGERHVRLSSAQPEFWRFSIHELGYYDLPATIDYALLMNGERQKSLHYIGYSQGTTAGFVLVAARPDYERKIRLAQMLAPVAYVRHIHDHFSPYLAPILGHSDILANILGAQQVLPQNDLYLLFAYNACGAQSLIQGVCITALSMMEGDPSNLNRTGMLYMMQTHPAGASTNQIIQLMQAQQSGRFCQFDFGARRNMEKYGQTIPPEYNLKTLKTQFHLWFGENDAFAVLQDIDKLAHELPKRTLHRIPDPLWDHLDFQLANQLREYVNEPVLRILQDYEAENSL